MWEGLGECWSFVRGAIEVLFIAIIKVADSARRMAGIVGATAPLLTTSKARALRETLR